MASPSSDRPAFTASSSTTLISSSPQRRITSSPNTSDTFKFLSLPGEIRNTIYDLLLVIPPPSATTTIGEKWPISPNVLRISKRIYHESLPRLFQQNTFIAHPTKLTSLPQLRRWLDPVTSPHLISLIQKWHIFVRLECDARFSAEDAERTFSGKEELTVECFQSQFRGSGNEVLRLFEGIRGVRKARVFGSIGDWPEYVRGLEKAMMSPVGTVVELKRDDEVMVDEGVAGLEGLEEGVGALEVVA